MDKRSEAAITEQEAKAAHEAAVTAWDRAYTAWHDTACDEKGEHGEPFLWDVMALARERLYARMRELKAAVTASGKDWDAYMHAPSTSMWSRIGRLIRGR